MVGLGVMGCNFLLNMADQCFSVTGYDKDVAKVGTLRQESKERDVPGASDIKDSPACSTNRAMRSKSSLTLWSDILKVNN